MRKLPVFALLVIVVFFNCKKEPIEKNKPYCDRDGMLLIDGKRTFVIGSYHTYPGDDPYRKMAEDDYILVRVRADREQVDAAHASGLYTWLSVGVIDTVDVKESEARIRETVQKWKNHPGLLCWEIADEPAFTWKSAEPRVPPGPFIQTYDLIKREDPNHPVYTNHAPVNLVATMRKYNPGTDIIACDIYPVIPKGIRRQYALNPDGLQGDMLNTYISQVGEYTDKMRRVAGPYKTVFMVLQGFAWESLRQENDRDPNMIRYPTFEESRFMAYNAIIHGANGIIYWGTNRTPKDTPFWTDLRRVVHELSVMREVLSAQRVLINIGKIYHELGHSVDAGVEVLVKQVDGNTYLLTANADRYPVKVTLTGLGDFQGARVLTEGREISVNESGLTDFYEPFAVHVYALSM